MLWFLSVIFCAILTLVTGKDLGSIIRIAQCRSTCLQKHEKDGCENKTSDCQQCWYSCNVLENLEKELRRETCEKYNCKTLTFISDWPENTLNGSKREFTLQDLLSRYLGCETACTFFKTKEAEMEAYDASKLPAPEMENEISMNDYDVAIVMHKDEAETWVEDGYYFAKQRPTLAPLEWIIIVGEKGAIKHYSWEKWWPELNMLVTSDTLDEAFISWHDWRAQLRRQRDTKLTNLGPCELELLTKNDELSNPSFVVTWQQESGYGITGNQVTKSESAQISLSVGNKYLVRIASSDGPGSYPIVIPAVRHWTQIEIKLFNIKFTLIDSVIFIGLLNACLGILLILKAAMYVIIMKIFKKNLSNQMKTIYINDKNNTLEIEVERIIITPWKENNMETKRNNLVKNTKERLTDTVIINIINDGRNENSDASDINATICNHI